MPGFRSIEQSTYTSKKIHKYKTILHKLLDHGKSEKCRTNKVIACIILMYEKKKSLHVTEPSALSSKKEKTYKSHFKSKLQVDQMVTSNSSLVLVGLHNVDTNYNHANI